MARLVFVAAEIRRAQGERVGARRPAKRARGWSCRHATVPPVPDLPRGPALGPAQCGGRVPTPTVTAPATKNAWLSRWTIIFNTAILAQILDLCDQTGARITLFPVGKRILESDGDLWRRVVDSGHEIGNHTNNHRKLTRLDGYQISTEVRDMQKRLNAAIWGTNIR